MVSTTYEILPTVDPDQLAVTAVSPTHSSFIQRIKLPSLAGLYRIFYAHADALDTAWLAELDRLGGPVFLCFMILRLGLLSLSVFWGFLLVSPLWCISLISNEQFLPSALQMGLIITFLIIIEPIPFIALMHDARSKIFHVLYAAYLSLAWREVCIFLVSGDALGHFVVQSWVRDLFYTAAAASVIICGAVGWTLWEGLARRLWALTTLVGLLFLQTTYQRYRTDTDI